MDAQNGFAQALHDYIEDIIQNIPRERRTETLTNIIQVIGARPSKFFRRRLLLLIERILIFNQIVDLNNQLGQKARRHQ